MAVATRSSSKTSTTKTVTAKKRKPKFNADAGDFYKIPSQGQFTLLGIAAYNGQVFADPMGTFCSRELAKKEIERGFEIGTLVKKS